MKNRVKKNGEFSPSIILFTCNHHPYGALQMIGMNKRVCPPGYLFFVFTCIGSLSQGMILKAFKKGVDGVLVLGCPENLCHHNSGSDRAFRNFLNIKILLPAIGISSERLEMKRVSAYDFEELAEALSDFYSNIRRIGPFTSLREIDAEKR